MGEGDDTPVTQALMRMLEHGMGDALQRWLDAEYKRGTSPQLVIEACAMFAGQTVSSMVVQFSANLPDLHHNLTAAANAMVEHLLAHASYMEEHGGHDAVMRRHKQ